ncbi:MAG: DinB family protein [Chloroflexota bacterium]
MAHKSEPIRHFYADWTQYRSRLVDGVRDLTADQLAISIGPDHTPIWALAAHCAGTRTYWLCGVLGEPGAETTPFPDPLAERGWEDDLDHPRSAAELVVALETTGAIIDRCLDTWTTDMLEVDFERWLGDVRQLHTRRSILLRLLSHDAFHSGEISQLLGANGLPAIDLWVHRTT